MKEAELVRVIRTAIDRAFANSRLESPVKPAPKRKKITSKQNKMMTKLINAGVDRPTARATALTHKE